MSPADNQDTLFWIDGLAGASRLAVRLRVPSAYRKRSGQDAKPPASAHGSKLAHVLEALFGGATREVPEGPGIPLLMPH